jgi:hypothetical protein
MRDRNKQKLSSLQEEMEFLTGARKRHLKWAAETQDDEATKVHIEIALLFGQIMRQHDRLLGRYGEPLDAGTAR